MKWYGRKYRDFDIFRYRLAAPLYRHHNHLGLPVGLPVSLAWQPAHRPRSMASLPGQVSQ